MELDKDYNVVVKKFELLDDKYVAWIGRVNASRLAEDGQRESLAQQASAAFQEFVAEFELSLPEMAYIMYRDFNQTMEIDVRGVPAEAVSKLIERAKEHKIGAILDVGSLTLCALPRQEKEPDLKLLEDPGTLVLPDSAPEQTQPSRPITRPTRSLVKDFRYRPDPIEAVRLLQVLPSEDTIVLDIERPEDFGSPVTAIHTDLELTFVDRSVVNRQAELSAFEGARLRLESLKTLRQLVLTLRPQNAFGLQTKSKVWKFLFPVQHDAVLMLGRNDYCQIDSELVPQQARAAIEANGEHDYYCTQWAEVRPARPDLRPIKALSRSTTLAVTSNCQLLQWGLHRRLEGGRVVEEPTFMFLHPKLLVQQVGLGNTFAAVVTVEGRVFTWGDNRAGQLGLGHFSELAETPQLVAGLQHCFIVDLRCGVGHTLCLDDSGVAYSWGQNQAVTGTPVLNRFGEQISFSNRGVHQPQPFPISSKAIGADARVVWVASGEFNLGLVTSKGELFLWGDNEDGLLGDFPGVHSAVPVRVVLPHPAKRVHIGFDHSVVETVACEDGRQHFFAWGNNLEGQCAQPPCRALQAPAEVTGLPEHIAQFWCGLARSYFVDSERRVWAVGQGLPGLFASAAAPVCTEARAAEVFEVNGTATCSQ